MPSRIALTIPARFSSALPRDKHGFMPVTLNPGAYENFKFSFLLKPLALAAKLWGREVAHSRPQNRPVLLVGKNDMVLASTI